MIATHGNGAILTSMHMYIAMRIVYIREYHDTCIQTFNYELDIILGAFKTDLKSEIIISACMGNSNPCIS